METANDATIEVVLGLEEDELSKTKDELVDDFEKEHEKYMKNAKDIQSQMEELVVRAEELLAGLSDQPVSGSAGVGATAASGDAAAPAAVSVDMLRPQQNLKPTYLDKNANHLEVKNFCQMVDTYICTGYKDSPPRLSGTSLSLMCTPVGIPLWSRIGSRMEDWKRL